LKWLNKVLRRTKVYKKPVAKHELTLAFVSKGVSYYSFDNEFHIPVMRAFWGMDFLGMMKEKTDSKYHVTAYSAVIEYCKAGNLLDAAKIAEFAIERMGHITNVDLMYKLASVFYLSEDEIVEDYNTEFGEKKIKLWQSDPEINSFFLNTRMSEYLDCLSGSGVSIEVYTDIQRKRTLRHLKQAFSQLSSVSKNKELLSTLESQIKELEELITQPLGV
jgi:hypothetical protein